MKKSDLLKIFVDSYELHAGNDPDWLYQMGMQKQKERAYETASKVLDDLLDACWGAGGYLVFEDED